MAIYGTLGESSIGALDASISGTAADIFVYDTSQDSDGGAWRKRTQYTSWYNETLNTSTRGSRKEFPCVAVIVAESDKVIIYDGDDPDMPMWMEFISTSNQYGGIFNGRNVLSIVAKNGEISCADSLDSVVHWNFISDTMKSTASSGSWNSNRNIKGRNPSDSTNLWKNYDGGRRLVNYPLNDIAITVLPNAPIDSTTGLPIATIAVATDGGVSVLRDDGIIFDWTETIGPNSTHKVSFRKDGKLGVFTSGTPGVGGYPQLYYIDITSADISSDYYYTSSSNNFEMYGGSAWETNTPNRLVMRNEVESNPMTQNLTDVVDAPNLTYAATNAGLNAIIKPEVFLAGKADMTTAAVSYIQNDYNTGYMIGDIKGAFLSDTDTTNVTYTTVADDWATAGAWTKQSNITISSTGSGTSGTLSISGANSGSNVYFFNSITVEANTDYVVSVTFGAYNASDFFINTTQYSTSNQVLNIHGLSGLTRGGYFNSGSNTTLYIQGWQFSNTTTTITNVVVQKVSEMDRSVNNNSLQVFGTITKSAVATGADLVGYSGFSSSNALVQPYNSDMNPGTGDYSLMFWFKTTATTGEEAYFRRISTSGGCMIRMITSSSLIQWYTKDASTAYVANSNHALDDGVWHCVVGTRKGSTMKLYVDGVLSSSAATSAISHDSTTNDRVIIGGEFTGTEGTFQNSADASTIALLRYSLSAPSPEKIKQMYEDEKVLFQENAACTLYGSSDAVTALGYDDSTNLLHVGTSSGRSDFQGLCRINNTTTAVTTAISASGELIAEQ